MRARCFCAAHGLENGSVDPPSTVDGGGCVSDRHNQTWIVVAGADRKVRENARVAVPMYRVSALGLNQPWTAMPHDKAAAPAPLRTRRRNARSTGTKTSNMKQADSEDRVTQRHDDRLGLAIAVSGLTGRRGASLHVGEPSSKPGGYTVANVSRPFFSSTRIVWPSWNFPSRI